MSPKGAGASKVSDGPPESAETRPANPVRNAGGDAGLRRQIRPPSALRAPFGGPPPQASAGSCGEVPTLRAWPGLRGQLGQFCTATSCAATRLCVEVLVARECRLHALHERHSREVEVEPQTKKNTGTPSDQCKKYMLQLKPGRAFLRTLGIWTECPRGANENLANRSSLVLVVSS